VSIIKEITVDSLVVEEGEIEGFEKMDHLFCQGRIVFKQNLLKVN